LVATAARRRRALPARYHHRASPYGKKTAHLARDTLPVTPAISPPVCYSDFPLPAAADLLPAPEHFLPFGLRYGTRNPTTSHHYLLQFPIAAYTPATGKGIHGWPTATKDFIPTFSYTTTGSSLPQHPYLVLVHWSVHGRPPVRTGERVPIPFSGVRTPFTGLAGCRELRTALPLLRRCKRACPPHYTTLYTRYPPPPATVPVSYAVAADLQRSCAQANWDSTHARSPGKPGFRDGHKTSILRRRWRPRTQCALPTGCPAKTLLLQCLRHSWIFVACCLARFPG